MPADVLKLFEEKSVEFSTLKRVYCSKLQCGRFICPQKTNTSWFFGPPSVPCPDPTCKTRTCSSCKTEVKPDEHHVCRQDQQAVDVLALGRQEGWQRCPGCEQLIELNMGCYHMTCRCRTEFCYLCRARWKSCGCPQWDENRLLRAAEARVNARFGQGLAAAAPAAPAPRQAVPPVNAARAPPPVIQRAPAPRPDAAPVQAPRATQVEPVTTIPFQVRGLWDRPGRRPASTASTISTGSRASTSTAPPAYWDVVNSASTSSTASSSHQRDPAYSSNWSGVAALPASRQTRQPKGKTVRFEKTPNTTHNRDQLIREAMDELRVNHECSHDRWQYVRRAGKCEHCQDYLPIYLYVSDGYLATHANSLLTKMFVSAATDARCSPATGVAATDSRSNSTIALLSYRISAPPVVSLFDRRHIVPLFWLIITRHAFAIPLDVFAIAVNSCSPSCD